MREKIGKNMILFTALIAYIITGFYNFEILIKAMANTWVYIKEMLEILPAVFVLTGLINAWVPAELISKNFGRDSGFRGKITSLLLGTISAGPIYAAFPLAQSLMKKGASISNTVIIISAWAVVKLPMFIVETKFLGIDFAATRFLLTVPIILLMGIICDKLLDREEILNSIEINQSSEIAKIADVLPQHNCGSCGFNTCLEYARAVSRGTAGIDRCVPGGENVADRLRELVNYSKTRNSQT